MNIFKCVLTNAALAVQCDILGMQRFQTEK